MKLVRQFVYRTHSLNKPEVVSRILQARTRGLTIIFSRTKRSCQRLADDLQERGFATGSIHGDLRQETRERALRAFRNGKVDVLVATDVAARGIDVDDVTHVINYECPEDDKTYIHRIGRTARAGHSGTAITFVDWEDLTRWRVINKTLELGFEEPLETYHTSAHLYADLDIPTDATGYLPRSKRVRAGLQAEEIEDLGGSDPGARPERKSRTKGKKDAKANRSSTTKGREERRGDKGEKRGKGSGSRTDKTKSRDRKRTRRKREGGLS